MIRGIKRPIVVAILFWATAIPTLSRDCSDAEMIATRAFRNWQEGGDPFVTLTTLRGLRQDTKCFDKQTIAALHEIESRAAAALNRFNEAEEALHRQCDIISTLPDTPKNSIELILCTINGIRLQLNQRKIDADVSVTLDSAIAQLDDLLENAAHDEVVQRNAVTALVRAIVLLGSIQAETSSSGQAQLSFERATQALEAWAPTDNTLRASLLHHHASFLTSLNHNDNALEMWEEAIGLRFDGDAILHGAILSHMAIALSAMGRIEEAIDHQWRAYELISRGTSDSHAPAVVRARATLCAMISRRPGQFDELGCLDDILSRLDALVPEDRLALLDQYIAGLLSDPANIASQKAALSKDPDSHKTALLDSLDTLVEMAQDLINSEELQPGTDHWLLRAQVAKLHGNTQEALLYASNALWSAESIADELRSARALVALHPDTERAEQIARDMLQKVAEDEGEHDSHVASLLGEVATRMANAPSESGHEERMKMRIAESWADAAVAVAARLRNPMDDLLSCSFRGETKSDLFRDIFITSTVLKLRRNFLEGANYHDLQQVFSGLQRAEGSISRLTWHAGLSQLARGHGDRIETLAQLLRHVDSAVRTKCGSVLDAPSAITRGVIDELFARLSQDPHFGPHVTARPISMYEVQLKLRPGEVVIGFVIGDERGASTGGLVYAVYRSVEDGVEGVELLINEFGKPFRETMDAIEGLFQRARGDQQLAPFPLGRAEYVYDSLFRSFLSEIERDRGVVINDIVIVVDEALMGLPFNALRAAGDDGSREWFGLQRRLSFVPSLRSLVDLPRSMGKLERYYGLGDPHVADGEFADLRATRKELLEIGGLFPASRGTVRLDEGATLDELMAGLAQSPDLVVLSTHGTIVDDTLFGQRFGLVLASGAGGEDHLTAKHLRGMDLESVDLLALAACNTARSEVGFGDLLAGFLGAGVRRIVASQWYVNDMATRKLMVEVAKSVVEGETVVAALQRSMSLLAESDDFNHPYFWAPFVVFGLPEDTNDQISNAFVGRSFLFRRDKYECDGNVYRGNLVGFTLDSDRLISFFDPNTGEYLNTMPISWEYQRTGQHAATLRWTMRRLDADIFAQEYALTYQGDDFGFFEEQIDSGPNPCGIRFNTGTFVVFE